MPSDWNYGTTAAATSLASHVWFEELYKVDEKVEIVPCNCSPMCKKCVKKARESISF